MAGLKTPYRRILRRTYPITLAYLTSSENTSNLSSYTFSSVSFGAVENNKKIAVVVGTSFSGTTSGQIASVTIDGVLATEAANQAIDNGGADSIAAAIFYAEISDTSGDITVSLNATARHCKISVYSIEGNEGVALFDTSSASANPSDISVNTYAQGAVIAGCASQIGSNNITWSGAAVDSETSIESSYRYESSSVDDLPKSTPLNVSAEDTGSPTAFVAVAASFGGPS